jgi:competence protein ComFB
VLAFAHHSDENNHYVVVNVYEELVKQNVLTMVEYMNMCSCEKCISDACALVLNQLPPLYVTTRKGELITQVHQTTQDQHIDLTVKVVQALQMVKESPRH